MIGRRGFLLGLGAILAFRAHDDSGCEALIRFDSINSKNREGGEHG
jgi:hypothetical protein